MLIHVYQIYRAGKMTRTRLVEARVVVIGLGALYQFDIGNARIAIVNDQPPPPSPPPLPSISSVSTDELLAEIRMRITEGENHE